MYQYPTDNVSDKTENETKAVKSRHAFGPHWRFISIDDDDDDDDDLISSYLSSGRNSIFVMAFCCCSSILKKQSASNYFVQPLRYHRRNNSIKTYSLWFFRIQVNLRNAHFILTLFRYTLLANEIRSSFWSRRIKSTVRGWWWLVLRSMGVFFWWFQNLIPSRSTDSNENLVTVLA